MGNFPTAFLMIVHEQQQLNSYILLEGKNWFFSLLLISVILFFFLLNFISLR